MEGEARDDAAEGAKGPLKRFIADVGEWEWEEEVLVVVVVVLDARRKGRKKRRRKQVLVVVVVVMLVDGESGYVRRACSVTTIYAELCVYAYVSIQKQLSFYATYRRHQSTEECIPNWPVFPLRLLLRLLPSL